MFVEYLISITMKNGFLFKKHINAVLQFFLISFLFTACQEDSTFQLHQGIIINESIVLEKDTFFLEGVEGFSNPAIIIGGENIVVDFNGTVIIGSQNYSRPELFKGLGIEIRNGKNITIKNLVLKGYKVGLRAREIQNLKIENADLSYNYRQVLKSTREKENEEDRMSYHQNDEDEWLRYGMAVYLKNCDHAIVKNLKITGGQNGLMMSGCNEGFFYNNDIRFNSGVGIGMYRSSKNKVMHNQLDWNIRGFSFGIYNRDQGSAGILLYEQCNENTIAFNSATHCGNGFSFRTGHSTDESGDSAYGKNVFYKNNFSYSSDDEKIEANVKNQIAQLDIPEKLQDGMNTSAPGALGPYTGRKHIIMDQYGPYNFQYPKLILRNIENNIYTFAIFGPFGNWKAKGGTGFKMMSQKQGAIPATLVLEAEENGKELSVELEYIGPAYTDQFGVFHKKGKPYKMIWNEKKD